MFRFQTISKEYQAEMPMQQFIKDDGFVSTGQMMVFNITDEGKFTGQQLFYTITDVQTPKAMKGIKKGFVYIKLKRTKSPLAAIASTADVIAEDSVKAD